MGGVSFVSRDITGRHNLRYITCPTKYEIIEHKHILFGHPDTFKQDTCIVVEGVFDVFRFGVGAVATFGIKYTQEQLKLLSTMFSKVYVMYDDDPQAVISMEIVFWILVWDFSKEIEWRSGDYQTNNSDKSNNTGSEDCMAEEDQYIVRPGMGR